MTKFYLLSISILIAFFLLFSSPPLFAEEGSSTENVQPEVSDEPLFDNQEAALHYQKGVSLYQKRSYSKAAEELEKAIEINPDYKEAYYLLGYAYYKMGKIDLSREAFNQAYELDPKYSPNPPK
jgi:tetratricopeptide (TPR) repeat protein